MKSLIAQLKYLLALANENTNDHSKLNTVNIGRMTANDIDNWDPELAEILHLVAAEAGKMKIEYGSKNE